MSKKKTVAWIRNAVAEVSLFTVFVSLAGMLSGIRHANFLTIAPHFALAAGLLLAVSGTCFAFGNRSDSEDENLFRTMRHAGEGLLYASFTILGSLAALYSSARFPETSFFALAFKNVTWVIGMLLATLSVWISYFRAREVIHILHRRRDMRDEARGE